MTILTPSGNLMARSPISSTSSSWKRPESNNYVSSSISNQTSPTPPPKYPSGQATTCKISKKSSFWNSKNPVDGIQFPWKQNCSTITRRITSRLSTYRLWFCRISILAKIPIWDRLRSLGRRRRSIRGWAFRISRLLKLRSFFQWGDLVLFDWADE